jgi:glyoxylase-like metal-dependent hydrolase (beta-lactamase superfamily II)
MSSFRLGDLSITRVLETEGPEFDPTVFYPDCTWDHIEPHRAWLEPHFLDPTSRKLNLAIQSFVVSTPRHTILVDSCVGEHKERRYDPGWNLRTGTAYLANLAAAGFQPEDIDFVLCTHLHPDHVGWNTQLIDGNWIPTFPNARYLFAHDEYTFWQAKSAKDPRKYDDGAFADSVLPIVEAGRAQVVDHDHAVDDTVWIEPSPGHTPGHVSIRLASSGAEAVMSGDLMHTVLQIAFPDWSSGACFDKDLSRRTRRAFLDRYCESGTVVMPAHFPSPTFGHIERNEEAFGWRYFEA